jgi:hypothetical protein
MNKDQDTSTPILKKPLWLRILMWLVIIFFFMPILISLILHIPFVQNWAVDGITTVLSNKIEEEVKIQEVDFSVFSGIRLEGFSVISLEKDTIIGAKSLNVDLGRNLFSLFKNELAVNTITLESPRLNVIRTGAYKETNLERLIKKLTNPRPLPGSKKKKGAIKIILRQLDIYDIDLTYDDQLNGNRYALKSNALYILVDDLNLDSNRIELIDLSLKDMQVNAQTHLPKQEVICTVSSDSKKTNRTKPKPFQIQINNILIQNGSILMDNVKKEYKSEIFEIDEFDLHKIELSLQDLAISDNNILGDIRNFTFQGKNGFELSAFSSPNTEFSDREIKVPNLILRTNKSSINADIELKYKDRLSLNDLAQKAILKSNFNSSEIALSDLIYFIPNLNNSKFFINNKNKIVNLDGEFTGRLANLKGKNVSITIPGVIAAKGSFGTRNLNTRNPLINLRLKSLNTTIEKLKRLIPTFRPPGNFNKLGKIVFKGNFDGYINDFVAYGTMISDLGRVKTDMRLDLKKGMNEASYSGDIVLDKFNLRKWSGNDNFGNITFSGKVRNGQGLTINNAYADMEGYIDNFEFKGYIYNKININGALDKSTFNGKLASSDLNFNFGFDGFAEFVNQKINFDFIANIGAINFKEINLSKQDLTLRGNLNINGTGSNIDDIIGKVEARNLIITQADSSFVFDSILVNSYKANDSKILEIISDGSTIDLKGQYRFKTLLNDLKNIIKKNYPYHSRGWKYEAKEISSNQNFVFDINLRDNKRFIQLLNLPFKLAADTLFAKGELISKEESITMVTIIPEFVITNNVLKNVFLSINSNLDSGNLSLNVDNGKVLKNAFNMINISANVDKDNINFYISTDQLLDSIQQLNFGGKLTPFRNGYSITFDDNDIRIYDKRWKINADNRIDIDKGFINIEEFSLTDGNRLIQISDIENKGLILNVSKFDIALINKLLKDDRFIFSGDIFSNVRVSDIFKKSPDIYGNILMPQLKINGDSYGEFNVDISKPLNRPMDAIVSFNNEENGQIIKLNASLDFDQEMVNADLKAKNVPLKILQYLLYKGIVNTNGYADLVGTIRGPFKDLKVNAKGITKEASTKVIVLGETYNFSDQPFNITEKVIDLDGTFISDSEGGKGYVTGQINHTLFKDLYLNLYVSGTNVIALKTGKYDNPDYYGFGKGDVEASFTGSTNYPNINVTAITKKGTKVSIPIQNSQNTSDKSFITFIDKEQYFDGVENITEKSVKIDGVSLEMNLVITPEADVYLIFDENKGDIIEGRGEGNLQINMNRNGDFDFFGEYEIREGRYLFTAFSFVNKPFLVREGGKVRWNGDPVNATLDLKADYQVRTDLTIFLSEYLITEALSNAAANTTDVNLQMIIGNTLYNPNISFGLDFPDLTGDLKSYADSKVRLLRNNQNDLNSQVFGLLVFNSFLPSNTLSEVLVSGSYLQSASVNTLSEFVSSQLSSYITRFLNETLEEDGLISGIDFDINLRNNLSLQGIETNEFSVVPTEIEVKLKNEFRFWDGRLSFDFGGNFVRESLVGLTNYVVPEFVFRYALTKDRKLNLKVYGKYDLDEISVTSRRQRLGVGLRYRTEFGSMRETKSFIKNSVEKVDAEQDQPK